MLSSFAAICSFCRGYFSWCDACHQINIWEYWKMVNKYCCCFIMMSCQSFVELGEKPTCLMEMYSSGFIQWRSLIFVACWFFHGFHCQCNKNMPNILDLWLLLMLWNLDELYQKDHFLEWNLPWTSSACGYSGATLLLEDLGQRWIDLLLLVWWGRVVDTVCIPPNIGCYLDRVGMDFQALSIL